MLAEISSPTTHKPYVQTYKFGEKSHTMRYGHKTVSY